MNQTAATMNRTLTHTRVRSTLRVAAWLAGVGVAAGSAFAQSNIDPAKKYAWQENCGWLNFRDAGSRAGTQGVVIRSTYLAGWIWGENIGWINVGDGTPADGVRYANVEGTDFGVNWNNVSRHLTGLAWGENVGWINFSGGALATPSQPARFDVAAGRFRGYAWGENIGWINLEDSTRFVGGSLCPGDFNGSGAVSVQDVFDFLAAYFARCEGPGTPPCYASADFNNSGAITIQDLFDFLAAYFAGCL